MLLLLLLPLVVVLLPLMVAVVVCMWLLPLQPALALSEAFQAHAAPQLPHAVCAYALALLAVPRHWDGGDGSEAGQQQRSQDDRQGHVATWQQQDHQHAGSQRAQQVGPQVQGTHEPGVVLPELLLHSPLGRPACSTGAQLVVHSSKACHVQLCSRCRCGAQLQPAFVQPSTLR
jgi:hypothetical protein